MPPRKRKAENNGLPARWRIYHNAYYYRVPPGLEHLWDGKKQFRLGTTLPEAYQEWAKRIQDIGPVDTIADLIDRYTREVLPKKSNQTQRTESSVLAALRQGFGGLGIHELKPSDVYAMKSRIGQRSQSQANRHIAVLSHVYSMAIEWGVCDRHPIKNHVKRFKYEPRKRYVEDWELEAFLSVAPDLIVAYCPIKLLTGLRKGDILSLKQSDLLEAGLRAHNSKTGKTIMFRWTDELREAVEGVKALRGKVTSMWLFCTRTGQPYVKEDRRTYGFNSIWTRAMNQALKKTSLEARFTEHDLRAKTGSDMESDSRAQELLNHSSEALTKRVYRRRPKMVDPHTLKRG